MEAYQERVMVERDDLTKKVMKLDAFLGTDIFKKLPDVDRELLEQQYQVMIEYLDVLKKRIKNFNM